MTQTWTSWHPHNSEESGRLLTSHRTRIPCKDHVLHHGHNIGAGLLFRAALWNSWKVIFLRCKIFIGFFDGVIFWRNKIVRNKIGPLFFWVFEILKGFGLWVRGKGDEESATTAVPDSRKMGVGKWGPAAHHWASVLCYTLKSRADVCDANRDWGFGLLWNFENVQNRQVPKRH